MNFDSSGCIFHSISKDSCFKDSENCESFTKFWNFLNRSKIAAEVTKFQAGVLGQIFPKLSIVCLVKSFLMMDFFSININFPSNGFTKSLEKIKLVAVEKFGKPQMEMR